MPSNENIGDVDLQAASRAIMQRMLRISVLHRVDEGLDPLHVYQLQSMGLLERASPPPIDDTVADVFRQRDHPNRLNVPDGPMVFCQEAQSLTVIDVDAMILHPNHPVRCAALDFLKLGASSIPDPWLTPQSLAVVNEHEAEIKSDEHTIWQAAGVKVAPVIRRDLFAHLAAIRQSLATRYDDGLKEHLGFVLRPSFDSLRDLRPPLWSPTEQVDELSSIISDIATIPILSEALDKYTATLGYIPLPSAFGANQLLKQWMSQHGETSISWDDIASWADAAESPIAKYHAATIAIHIPDARPASIDTLWSEIVNILDVTESQESTDANAGWQLHCLLASHYARHIESLLPGQVGERVACYAWWLSFKVGQIIGGNKLAKGFLDSAVAPESELGFMHWMIARSQVVPSCFRYATLNVSSVWAMALLAQLSEAVESLSELSVPDDTRSRMDTLLRGYLIASPLGFKAKEGVSVFAFHENAGIEELVRWLMRDEEREAFLGVIAWRNSVRTPDDLMEALNKVLNLSHVEQLLLLFSIREKVFSSHQWDEAILGWLGETDRFVEVLNQLPPPALEHFLEALTELHCRLDAEWTVRLPNVLSLATERCGNTDRAKRLFLSILFMSINGGIVSPIQRVMASQHSSNLLETLSTWRLNAVLLGRSSEPWVAARVRAVSAAISRLIGPRRPIEQSLDCAAKPK